MEEIHKAVRSMQCNKAPGDPGDLGIDTLNALDDGNYSDCAKCLLILFNKIWKGDFPSDWNTASIISIPKKGDLTDCNNYRGISLINIGLKILSKIVTERISTYAFHHNIIRPEQYGFRNKEESISLYISIREILRKLTTPFLSITSLPSSIIWVYVVILIHSLQTFILLRKLMQVIMVTSPKTSRYIVVYVKVVHSLQSSLIFSLMISYRDVIPMVLISMPMDWNDVVVSSRMISS